MKKRLLGLVAIPLIAIGSLTYATDNEFIVHDTTGGTITVYGTGADGKIYGITIQDKNLGATEIYTGVDNKNTYGYYFQWGNNHGNSGDSSTVNTLLSTDDLSNWANKGYSGNVTQFIQAANLYGDYRSGLTNYTNYNETGAIQHSLWGGSGDNDNIEGIVKGYDTVNHVATNVTGRQGPCPEGYHVPSAGEWQELLKLYANAKGYTLNTQNGDYSWANMIAQGSDFSNDLKLPRAGNRDYNDGNVNYQGTIADYWSSSPRGGSYPTYAWYLDFDSTHVDPSNSYDRADGQSLRCFKNEYEEYYKNNGEIIHNAEEGTITFVHGGEAITIMDKNIGAEHVGYWYDADEGSYGTKFVYGGELVELGDGTYELKHWENNPCEQIGAYIPSYSSGWQLLLDIWGKIRKGRTGTIYGGYGPEDSEMISKDFLMPVGRGSNSGIVLFASELKDRNDLLEISL